MHDLLDDLEKYIVSTGLTNVVYKDMAPTKPSNVFAVYEYEGVTPFPQIAGADRSIQFLVRNENAGQARSLAKQLYNKFVTDDGILNLTNDRWCVVELKQPPFRLKVDEQSRVYYIFNATLTTYVD